MYPSGGSLGVVPRRVDPLAVRAAAGDPAARASIVAAHGPLVYGLCRRSCRDADDAYQEAWARVFAGLEGFDPAGDASLRTWIATVTHHLLVDRHRRRAVRGEVVELPDLAAPVEDVDARSRVERLEAALRRLPEAWRRVVVFHHLEELPLDTIAATEGVAVGTVKSRLHRARARLVELLEGT